MKELERTEQRGITKERREKGIKKAVGQVLFLKQNPKFFQFYPMKTREPNAGVKAYQPKETEEAHLTVILHRHTSQKYGKSSCPS